MPAIQAIQAVAGRGAGSPPPPPPPSQVDFFWAADNDSWVAFGGFQSASVFSNPAPANPVFTYLDFSYIGKTRDFTGSEWMASMNLGIGGAWVANANAISINFWFYPTANGVQLLSECNNQGVDIGYHYTVLDRKSTRLNSSH